MSKATTLSFASTFLGQIESQLNNSLTTTKFYLSKVNPKAINKINKSYQACISKDKPLDTLDDLKTGGNFTHREENGSETTPEPLLFKRLREAFYRCENLIAEYNTLGTFLVALEEAAGKNASDRTKYNVAQSEKNSIADIAFSAAASSDADEAEGVVTGGFLEVPLFNTLSSFRTTITEKDREWLFKHLRRDSSRNLQLYWKFDTYQERIGSNIAFIPIVSTNKKEVPCISLKATEFWDSLRESEEENIYNYFTAVVEILEKYRQGIADFDVKTVMGTDKNGKPITTTEMTESAISKVEQLVLSVCPKILLQCIKVGFATETVKRKVRIKQVTLKFKESFTNGKEAANFEWAAFKNIFSEALPRDIRAQQLKEIQVFSNDIHDEAIHILPALPMITKIPTKRPSLLEYGCPNWHRFLEGKSIEGYTKFKSQKMSELALAKTFISILSCKDYTRQVTIFFGNGNDGKSAIVTAFTDMLGPVMQQGFNLNSVKNQFGKETLLNLRCAVFDDVGNAFDMLNDEFIKQITGAGTAEVIVPIKYGCDQVWKPSGFKLIVCTNSKCRITNEASASRLLPIVCMRNYDASEQMDINDLVSSLVSEKANFTRWCVDLCVYYNNVRNAKGEISPLFQGAHLKAKQAKENGEKYTEPLDSFIGRNLLICSDIQFEKWEQGELNLLPNTERERIDLRNDALQYIATLPGITDPFVVVARNDDDDDNTSAYFESICNQLFEKNDDDFVSKAELGQRMCDLSNIDKRDIAPETPLETLYSSLRAAGMTGQSNWNKFQRTALYRNFMQHILTKYGLSEGRKVITVGKTESKIRAIIGLRMKSMAELAGETSVEDNFTAPDDLNF